MLQTIFGFSAASWIHYAIQLIFLLVVAPILSVIAIRLLTSATASAGLKKKKQWEVEPVAEQHQQPQPIKRPVENIDAKRQTERTQMPKAKCIPSDAAKQWLAQAETCNSPAVSVAGESPVS
jgi:hypothetical protein